MRLALGCVAIAAIAIGSPLQAQPALPGGGSSSVVPADSARDAELDAMTAVIASKLRCLVCRGQSVQESSAPLAREMQALIREKLEAGETPEEIEAFFIASYGDFILLKPRAQGLGLLVYALPIGGFLIALLAIVWKLRSGRAARADADTDAASEPAAPPIQSSLDDLDDEDRRWLDAAVRGES